MAIALQVLRTASSLESAARRAFKDFGLSPAQFNVLAIVSAFDAGDPTGVSFTVVADELLVDRSNVTGLVKRLVADGLLAVTDSPTDGRQKVLRFTAHGRRVWKNADVVYQAGLERVARAVGQRHLPALLEGLKQIETTADALYR